MAGESLGNIQADDNDDEEEEDTNNQEEQINTESQQTLQQKKEELKIKRSVGNLNLEECKFLEEI